MKIGFGAIGIKGGEPGNLDFISIDSFNNKDIAIVVDNKNIYFYKMDAYSGEDEDVPYIIKPIDIKSDSPLGHKLKRWKLLSQKYITSDIIVPNNNSIHTSTIQASGDLLIESSSGDIITFYSNGETNFPLTVSGLESFKDSHLTNKSYVDNFLEQSYDNILDIFNSLLDDFKQGITPTLDTDLKDKLYQLITDVNDYFNEKSNDLTDSTETYLTSAGDDLTDSTETYLTSAGDDLTDRVANYIDSGVNLLTEYSLSASYSTEPSAYYDEDEDPDVILLGDYYQQYDYERDIYTIDNWTDNGDVCYYDINHDINSYNFQFETWYDNEKIIPEKVEFLDSDSVRIIMPVSFNTETLKVVFLYRKEI